jgi:hypothetical protein
MRLRYRAHSFRLLIGFEPSVEVPFFSELGEQGLCDLATASRFAIEDARNFLSSCRQIYGNVKHAFDEKCFHVLPVKLESQSLRTAKDIVKKEQCRFVRKIFIRLDRVYVPLSLERPQEIARHCLYKILKRGLYPSTKCDTIIINYGLETEENKYRHYLLYLSLTSLQ